MVDINLEAPRAVDPLPCAALWTTLIMTETKI